MTILAGSVTVTVTLGHTDVIVRARNLRGHAHILGQWVWELLSSTKSKSCAPALSGYSREGRRCRCASGPVAPHLNSARRSRNGSGAIHVATLAVARFLPLVRYPSEKGLVTAQEEMLCRAPRNDQKGTPCTNTKGPDPMI